MKTPEEHWNDIVTTNNTILEAECCYCSNKVKVPVNHRIEGGWTRLVVCHHCDKVCFVSYKDIEGLTRVTHVKLVSDINEVSEYPTKS